MPAAPGHSPTGSAADNTARRPVHKSPLSGSERTSPFSLLGQGAVVSNWTGETLVATRIAVGENDPNNRNHRRTSSAELRLTRADF